MSWSEAKPTANDLLSDFATQFLSQKTAIRVGIEKHFNWRDASGASAGEPRLSDGSFGPGSARAFFGLQSAVSASKNGRLMVTSDTSRLYAVPASAPVLLGSHNALVREVISDGTIPSTVQWQVESGSLTNQVAASTITVSFAGTYAVAPFVQLTSIYSNATLAYTAVLRSSNTTNFAVQLCNIGGSGNSAGFMWRSEGTAVL